MLKIRLIPVVLMRNGMVVQSKGFSRYQALGNASTIVGRLSNWSADELIYLDISREAKYDLRREDLNYPNRAEFEEIMVDIAKNCFMPLTVGGGIRTLDQVRQRLKAGADKVSVNSQAFRDPGFISAAAREFGSQCVVVSIDVRGVEGSGGWEVFIDGGKTATKKTAVEWAREVESAGAGEILLNSIDRDGMRRGYDIELIRAVTDAVRIPVIALGGVGEWTHFQEAIESGGARAVAAANIFQYTENSVHLAKTFLHKQGIDVRSPLIKTVTGREGTR